MTEMLRGADTPAQLCKPASATHCLPGKTEEVWLIGREGQNDLKIPVDIQRNSQDNTDTQENKRQLPPPSVNTFSKATANTSAWHRPEHSCLH